MLMFCFDKRSEKAFALLLSTEIDVVYGLQTLMEWGVLMREFSSQDDERYCSYSSELILEIKPKPKPTAASGVNMESKLSLFT